MGSFVARHLGPRESDIDAMVQTMGYTDLDAFTRAVVPHSIAWLESLDLPAALSEESALASLATYAASNKVLTSMIGMGYYGTATPRVILRNILENPSWYTAYTPYQPEIAQGRLEALLNFQTMIEDLTGLPVAGSSLLDEPTAVAEAVALAARTSRSTPVRVLVDADTHPQTLAVLGTRAQPLQWEVVVHSLDEEWPSGDFAAVVISSPGTSGRILDIEPWIARAHERGAQAIVATDLMACTLITPPGELGADIVVGSAQRFGVPMGFGGPHAGFMAVRSGLERSLPGRLVGVSVDASGAPAYRLALQTREQHIRREKATSNICTAQVLLAVIAGMYAVYHGPHGLREIARTIHAKACALASAAGDRLVHRAFFDTVVIDLGAESSTFVNKAQERGINVRLFSPTSVAIACDELTTDDHIETLVGLLGGESGAPRDGGPNDCGIPTSLHRVSSFLEHPIFTSHHSETSLLRYMRELSDKDLALDRTMIPLGSCTMKLNATSEMEPITWPEFAHMHPFAPLDQAEGYVSMIRDLEQWLAEVTGYFAVSVQPNAGSQGEFAGLLAIAGYHRSRGDHNRTICLIPSSAHGTNAASAVMAGMRVVVVACDSQGNVDVEDLQRLVLEHRDELAALMITYPSTHGVFETAVTDICAMVHDAGGQVYVDGANLNALVGLAKPGKFGADVSHLNLHKTFCIPHGGGGPGVGPVAVREHLAPFLPSHPLRPECGPSGRGHHDGGVGPVSGAPWGSAGILPISYMYIAMMGPEGLKKATQVAIVNANYIAHRLRDHYPILYSGDRGLVAHECIIDIRPLTASSGISVDDIAKRLMDYGFHAPTMSFPVAGTLMIEPTESENVAELDRFCDAMIAIKGEIDAVERGEWPADDNPLVNAPHTADAVVGPWEHAYPARLAAFPGAVSPSTKYWPPVRRIDGAFGDRNLVCACPRPEELAAAQG